MQEILKKSAMAQYEAIKNKEVSAVELTKASLERIKSVDDKLGAFNSLTEETALETAKKVADYFICEAKKNNYKIKCDFCQPEGDELYDSSAASIASCGMIEIYRETGDEKYLEAAEKLILATALGTMKKIRRLLILAVRVLKFISILPSFTEIIISLVQYAGLMKY